MRTLIAGASGLIGSKVAGYLESQGHVVVRLVRRTPGAGEVLWDPVAGTIDGPGLEGFDYVVHLASMPWPVRWTSGFKKQIRANRLGTNSLLAETLAARARKPSVLVCASGMGIYPPSGEQILTEVSPTGTSFLANLQRDGEAATLPASKMGVRVVHLRIPPVLHAAAIRRGTSRIGDGRQWVSWVGLDEMASIIEFALTTEALQGPVNPVSPTPMRNADFATAVSQALGKEPGGSMPAFLVRLLMGEMGEELMLASRRIQPAKLLAAGYLFRFPELGQAVQHEMGTLIAS